MKEWKRDMNVWRPQEWTLAEMSLSAFPAHMAS